MCQLVNVLTAQQQHLTQLMPGSQKEEFLVNLLQTVTNLAEHPQCRAQLQQADAGELQRLLQGMQQGQQSDMVQKAAETALRMVQFSTWPGVCPK